MTEVEGDPKAPSSTATTSRCWGGQCSFPWIPSLTFDLYLIIPSVKQGSFKYHFLIFRFDST